MRVAPAKRCRAGMSVLPRPGKIPQVARKRSSRESLTEFYIFPVASEAVEKDKEGIGAAVVAILGHRQIKHR